MTEIPEHLLKRAAEARDKAARSNHGSKAANYSGELPDLLSPSLGSSKPENPHDALDWSRFGTRPMLLAKKVFDFVGSPDNQKGYVLATQRLARADESRELYTFSQLVKREIGDGLFLRVGHVLSLEVEKPRLRRVADGIRNFGSEMAFDLGANDSMENISIVEFTQAAKKPDSQKYSHDWTELLVDVNGPDEPGIDMLTSFSVRLAENTAHDPNDLTSVYWGSSAQVIHPLQKGDEIQHYGYNTLRSHEYIRDDATVTAQGSRLGSRGAFRWVGGEHVKWSSVSSNSSKPPTNTDVVEAAMSGIDVSLGMMQDSQIALNADEHNRKLQAALQSFA